MKHFILFVFVTLGIVQTIEAQQPDPLRSADAIAQLKWVDSVYQSLTLEEKIGQLFVPMVYPKQDENHLNEMLELVKTYQLGGVIFSKGTPYKQSRWLNTLQQQTKVPLLATLDAEWGAAMRLDSLTPFPWNMTLGAIQDPSIITSIGYQMGQQLKRLGIHMNFAPVLDINTNPENPIIGNRSFGEDAKSVTEKAKAMMEGLQQARILTSGKHFPGHGDTAQDSHKTLPTVSFDRARIDSVELAPYKTLMGAGLSSVMVAHLNIPAIDPSGLPMSLSKKAIQEVLLNQMGFNGLVLTDAMNMKGVADYQGVKNADLAAFLAGNDMLLISNDIPEGIKTFKKAYRRNEITEARLAHSVKKILKAKYYVGLHHYTPIDMERDLIGLSTTKDTLLLTQAMERAITVLKNENILPLNPDKQYGYLMLGDDEGAGFLSQLQKYGKVRLVKGDDFTTIVNQLEGIEALIIGFHRSDATPYKNEKFSNDEVALINALAQKIPVVLDVFVKPYALKALEGNTSLKGIVVSYQNNTIAQRVSADVLWGTTDARGLLPVTVSDDYPVGSGIMLQSLKKLGYATPAMQGFDPEKLKQIEAFAQVVLDSTMTPGLQMLVARRGKIIFHKSFGYHTYEKKRPVQNSDVYDLASLTKILGTMPMVLKAYDEYKFNLNSSLGALLTDWKTTNKNDLSVREILSHYGRLTPFIPFYKATLDKNGKPRRKFYRKNKSTRFGIRVTDELYLRSSYNKEILKEVKQSNLRDTLEYKYSDLAFFLMKYYLEETYQKPLDQLVSSTFYTPLGLKNTMYNAADRIPLDRITPSEDDTFFRYKKLQGYVHDEGAAMLGGVGGHAGLFSNAFEVAVLMQMYLQKGFYDGKRFFKETTFDAFNNCYYCDENNRRGVGFDKPQLEGRGSTCGCVSHTSFGHFGFTGTYTWADPEKEIVFVFLSNRTYPTRANNLLGEHDIRTRMQGLVYDALIY
jgi:beta-glucosidase-like glycosyl hydrolase/CubicO group peptidase (beta-lactamase class C family)